MEHTDLIIHADIDVRWISLPCAMKCSSCWSPISHQSADISECAVGAEAGMVNVCFHLDYCTWSTWRHLKLTEKDEWLIHSKLGITWWFCFNTEVKTEITGSLQCVISRYNVHKARKFTFIYLNSMCTHSLLPLIALCMFHTLSSCCICLESDSIG